MELTIAVLLPDVLGTYSDAGNAVILAERARRRGIATQVCTVTIADAPPRSADIYVLGGGEDAAQQAAARWLLRHRMRDELADRHAVLAVCAGFQLLGTTITDRDGRVLEGVGALDVTTSAGPRRAVGEVIASATVSSIGELTGFENHRGHTTLGPGVQPLAVPSRGTGNGTRRHGRPTEGALTPTIVGTYLHGPVLARNPALADHLLGIATGQDLTPLDTPDQQAMRRAYLERRRRPPALRGFLPRRYRAR
ncbi:CobB/CobQ domain protein glutamine amidotransferase [Pseudonocardia dioxanivorans CB1190]|uniref:Lipid II isoglutaminyl synthase (glutamine-hydrolyzing) subunit GatD n=1 Tax=Pseudonocardia dioxanivorans (strain ATCC 55486 / DSM 44775 / JCM 13855 / CB1190) TaxID=675635 RepID=F4CLX8_PSEUX|nr:CobB/CobQ domain-containing protein glutamine amidotransferase [Pseudonocardia dioxanivorans]AEA22326.1 CobB/CobQ domain protein glutamine amidotransferase [Pseudonocardia dioxanivorans CB1190]